MRATPCNPKSWLQLGLLCTLLCWAYAGVAHAGVGPQSWQAGSRPRSAAVEPVLIPARADHLKPGCVPAPGTGTIRPLLVGVSKYRPPLSSLEGPENDIGLLSAALDRLGVSRVSRLVGSATKAQFVEAVQRTVAELSCGDLLLVYFSGHAFPSDRHTEGGLLFQDYEPERVGEAPFPGTTPNPRSVRMVGPGIVSYPDLVKFVEWLRTRGVHVALILDTHAGPGLGSALSDRQVSQHDWQWSPMGDTQQAPERPRPTGALFAMLGPLGAMETRLPPGGKDSRTFGIWTYAVAHAMQTTTRDAGFNQLAEASYRQYTELVTAVVSSRLTEDGPTFVASQPERPLFTTGPIAETNRAPAIEPRETRRIELSNPPLTRGATVTPWPSRNLQVEGKVLAPKAPRLVEVNQARATVNPDGSFQAQVLLNPGENRLAVTAWFDDVDYVPAVFNVVSAPDNRLIAGGRRFALMFANQDYKDPAYPPLRTPQEDVRAMQQLLGQKFGFETELILRDGRKVPLVVPNASRDQMLRSLSALRSVLQPQDSLLVYFAGHGIHEPATDLAYWLPVDAEKAEPATWISAQDVHNAVQRLPARHVLIVADSCFSGGLMTREERALSPSGDKERDQHLASLMVRNSRRFITSGANEPVQDGGGQGHSIFARAMLEGLRRETGPFSATDLFVRHIQRAVSANSKQVPQIFPAKLGHDGGDLVFTPTAAGH